MTNKNSTVTDYTQKIEAQLEEIFLGKAPALPNSAKDLIVTLGPWLVLISMIILFPVILGALGLSAILLPVSLIGGLGFGLSSIIALVFAIMIIGLQLMAIPGLFKRQARAWRLMFYVSLLSALQNILMFNLAGLIIGGAISWYILFQIKSKYTK
jgi:hypothetical protein